MFRLLRHLLDPSYLYAQGPLPLAQCTWRHVLLCLALGLGALAAGPHLRVAWRRESGPAEPGRLALAPSLAAWSCVVALALVILRFLVAGPLSARVWYLSAIAVAFGSATLYWARRWLRSQTWPSQFACLAPASKALACQLSPEDAPMPWPWQLVWVGVHVGGLYALWAIEGLGWWPAAVAVGCVVLAAWNRVRASGQAWSGPLSVARWLPVEVLTPLLLPYGTVLVRRLVVSGLGVDVAAYQAFPYADPWSPWFELRATLLAGMAGVVITTGALLWRGARVRRPSVQGVLGLAALVLGLAWYAATAAVHVSRGVTGSDPYCYLQMAADLAQRGTALHDFPLASLAREAGLPLWPIVHVGYHPPLMGTFAPTVWPIGWPALMAPFFLLGGEAALLWAAPLWTILGAILTWKLGQALWSDAPRGKRWLAVGVAVLITVTSREAVLRSLVPMSDAAAQALSVLTLLFFVRAGRDDALHWSALAGGSLALAYSVRHPQLFLALAALPLLLEGRLPRSRRRRWRHLVVFGAAALVCATPDLVYRTMTFGSPFAFESPEWSLISWRNLVPMFVATVRDGLLRRGEFGYLLPLVIYGAYRQWRRRGEGPTAAMMWLGFAGVLLFHLCYSALRLRDLISLFPLMALWAGWGIAELWTRASDCSGPATLRRAASVVLILLALSARTSGTLAMPWHSQAWTFGCVTEAERVGYDRLAAALPADAVVGCGLNSGAVERYTGHETVRPSSWSDQEFTRFLRALAQEGRTLYLLDDGEEMEALFSPGFGRGGFCTASGPSSLPVLGLGGQRWERDAVLYALDRDSYR